MTEFSEFKPPKVQTVVVSGGGSGIGRAIAKDLAGRGYVVAILGRTQANLDDTEKLAPKTGTIRSYVADVSDSAEVEQALMSIEHDLGSVDGVVANAAIHPKAFFVDQTAESFSKTMRTNVEGVANLIRPVLPGMLERNCGRIIVLGSLADIGPLPGSMAYSASKGALHALVKGLAAEIDGSRYPNVLVNEMSPGATKTAMSAYGREPENVARHVHSLLALPSGGPTGRFFQDGRELFPGESWKGAIKRLLGLRR